MTDDKYLSAGLEAHRVVTAIDAALRGKPKKPLLRARAHLDIAETHQDFEVRKFALTLYLHIVQEKGLVPWPEDIKRLEQIAETGPTPGIKSEANVVLGNLDTPDRAMLQQRIDVQLGMPKGFSQNPGDFKHTPTDIARYMEECVKIACTEGDIKMRVAAIDAWTSLLASYYELPIPPEQRKLLGRLVNHTIEVIARAADVAIFMSDMSGDSGPTPR